MRAHACVFPVAYFFWLFPPTVLHGFASHWQSLSAVLSCSLSPWVASKSLFNGPFEAKWKQLSFVILCVPCVKRSWSSISNEDWEGCSHNHSIWGATYNVMIAKIGRSAATEAAHAERYTSTTRTEACRYKTVSACRHWGADRFWEMSCLGDWCEAATLAGRGKRHLKAHVLIQHIQSSDHNCSRFGVDFEMMVIRHGYKSMFPLGEWGS